MHFITVSRAIGTGAVAGAAALLLWFGTWVLPHLLIFPYVAALLVTAACGLYVLLATASDSYRNPRRGVRIRPIRGFDIFAGLLLTGPAIWALYPFLAVF